MATLERVEALSQFVVRNFETVHTISQLFGLRI